MPISNEIGESDEHDLANCAKNEEKRGGGLPDGFPALFVGNDSANSKKGIKSCPTEHETNEINPNLIRKAQDDNEEQTDEISDDHRDFSAVFIGKINSNQTSETATCEE